MPAMGAMILPLIVVMLAGVAVPADEQALILTHLGFGVEAGKDLLWCINHRYTIGAG